MYRGHLPPSDVEERLARASRRLPHCLYLWYIHTTWYMCRLIVDVVDAVANISHAAACGSRTLGQLNIALGYRCATGTPLLYPHLIAASLFHGCRWHQEKWSAAKNAVPVGTTTRYDAN